MSILAGLPALREVVAAGYGEYVVEGLPASVERLNMQARRRRRAAHALPAAHFVLLSQRPGWPGSAQLLLQGRRLGLGHRL
jgi:hypothetical protein